MDYETFASRLNQVILELSIEHAGMLSMGVASYYKAGNDDIKKSNLTKTQQATISKISAEHFGYMAEFDKALGETLKENVKKIFEREGGFGDVKQEILQHVDDVFTGKENITINHVGQRRTVLNVDKHGNLYQTEKVIQQPYTTTPEAYADMLSRTASHRALERGRADALGKMFGKWRFAGGADERSRPWHTALLGKVYEYGTPESDMALSILGEPNCRHTAIAYFDDPDLDTPQEFYQQVKDDAGLYWNEEKEEWAMD